jgi:hypothetical protein
LLASSLYKGVKEEIITKQDNIGKVIFSGTPSRFNQPLAFEREINYLYSPSKRVD